MPVTFAPALSEPPYALFERVGDAGGPRAYVLFVGRPPVVPVGAVAAWTQYPCAFAFADDAVTAPLLTVATALGVAGATGNTRAVGWLAADGTAAAVVPVAAQGQGGQVAGGYAVPFGNLALGLPSGASVTVTDDGLTFAGTGSSGGIALRRGPASGSGGVLQADTVTLPLDNAGGGALGFSATWDANNLFTLARDYPNAPGTPDGGTIRYFTGGGGSYLQAVYPLLPLPDDDPMLALDVRLDPLAPSDGTRTTFLLSAVPDGYAAANARTIAGAHVTLAPYVGGAGRSGFWLARRPDTNNETGCVYLAPLGPFALSVPGRSGRLMCGLSGLEHLGIADGDLLDLVPNGAALAAGGSGPGPPLDPAFTTSWAALRPASPTTYVGQPSASVSYAAGAGAAMAYPGAVGSLLGTVSGSTGAFPWAAYGAAYADGDAPGTLLATLERTALAGVRADVLRGATGAVRPAGSRAALRAANGPAPPVFTGQDGKPLTGRSATPNGQVVVLNDDGTWHRVLLAKTPAGEVSFDGQPVVGARLSSALLREQLFLVISDWRPFANSMTPLLTVDGYDLDIRPPAGWPEPARTVLVFKYATSASLADLCAATGAWTDAADFVGDADAVAAASATLLDAIRVATETCGGDDPFAYFRLIAGDPAWTGMICFGAPVDASAMPPDLAMLVAGADGGLAAHHVGIEATRVTTDPATGLLDLAESSVFGVVHYPDVAAAPRLAARTAAAPPADPPSDPAYGYRLVELNVVFANSTVTEFHAKVGIRMDELFGRAVTLTPAQDDTPDEVVLVGAYQEHGGVGTVTLRVASTAAFSFAAGTAVRVLESFTLTDASLAPTTTTTGAGLRGARLTFAGALAFAAAPFPTAPELDLFSYGALRLTGLALDIAFTIGADGARVGPVSVKADLSAAAVSAAGVSPRAGSVVDQLPLEASAFLAAPAGGLTASALGGKVVNVVELAGAPASTDATVRASYTTSSVAYAVRYRLPLGSLGGLSDVRASIDASLVLCWGPSTYTPDDDGAAVYVQLPGATLGVFQFNLQGLLTTTFGDATLSRVVLPKGPTYVLLFNDVALSLLGYRFPPQVVTDFVLFAGTTPGARQPLGWSLAATQVGANAGG